jgi:hypothetical protein
MNCKLRELSLTGGEIELTHGKQAHGQLPGGGQPVGGQSLPGGAGVIISSAVGGGFVTGGAFVGAGGAFVGAGGAFVGAGGAFVGAGGGEPPSQSGHSILQNSSLNKEKIQHQLHKLHQLLHTSRLGWQAELGIHVPIPMGARNGFHRRRMRTRFRKRMVFSEQQVVRLGHLERTASY